MVPVVWTWHLSLLFEMTGDLSLFSLFSMESLLLILARLRSDGVRLGPRICSPAGISAVRCELAVGNVPAQFKAPDC